MASIDDMADEIMNALKDYELMAGSALKSAVNETAKSVKQEISANAPKRTGAYKKSWAIKKINGNSHSAKVIVHSRNRYQLTHLLENGHAKRGGGRVSGIPHIAPAEEHGSEKLVQLLRKNL